MTGKISEDQAVTTLTGVAYAGVQSGVNVKVNQSLIDLAYQPLTATLTSWAALSRASGFDAFIVTPTSANLRALLTDETGTGLAYFQGGALGTPASGVATNLTGTASGLTAGAVTTNANLTGPITSVGNATSIASQTGTGTKFVVDNSPSITTPTMTGPIIQTTAVDLQVGQIAFPATQNASSGANILDDYEEGTTTPTITATGGTFTTTSATLIYTKIGKQVTFTVRITITTVGTASGGVVFTLPFTAQTGDTSNQGSGGGIEDSANLMCSLRIASAATTGSILKYDGTTIIGAGRTIVVSGLYQAVA